MGDHPAFPESDRTMKWGKGRMTPGGSLQYLRSVNGAAAIPGWCCGSSYITLTARDAPSDAPALQTFGHRTRALPLPGANTADDGGITGSGWAHGGAATEYKGHRKTKTGTHCWGTTPVQGHHQLSSARGCSSRPPTTTRPRLLGICVMQPSHS